MKYISWLLSLGLLLGSVNVLYATISVPHFFSDNMVLQRHKPINIWGTGQKGETVTVELNGESQRAIVGEAGKWKITLPAMSHGGPFNLSIAGKHNTIILTNILIGDVWLCSGQSNMEFPLGGDYTAEESIRNATQANIRLLTVPMNAQKEDIKASRWVVCSPVTAARFTAIGYFFGKQLHENLHVPIGLINASVGGTDIEPWISWGASMNHPDYSQYKGKSIASVFITENYIPNGFASLLYNGMIHPLVGYAIKGVIWYQGENNTRNPILYRSLFPNLITDWRIRWQDDFPFLWVQLTSFMAPDDQPQESTWAELREAQNMALRLPKTGQAVVTDIGDATDIHPKNKKEVGLRLAHIAMNVAYGNTNLSCGPVFEKMNKEDNKLVLTFNHIGRVLSTLDKNKYGYVNGFALAGENRQFVWAQAYIRDNKVVVFSDKVSHPVAVRYGWANNPTEINLINGEGLLASPFRTDNWNDN